MVSTLITFKAFDGTLLRGDLYLPSHAKAVPLVILTHGLTLLKEQFLPNYARAFQDAGIAALVYDHRGYGSSDGLPRSETNIMQQVSDLHDAVTFAKTLEPQIDASRVCVWGIGHSGGMAMIAAALDTRIAACMLMMPFTSGTRDKAVFPTHDVWANKEAQVSETIRIWPDSMEEATAEPPVTLLRGKDAWEFVSACRDMTRKERSEEMPNALTLQSFYHIGSVDPMKYIHLIAPRPLLYMVAQTDTLTGPVEWHREVFSRAGGEKEFVLLEDHHLATYVGETFKLAARKQIDFLQRHLY